MIPETAEKIRAMAKQLGYRRDLRGVNLRTGKTNTICAVLTARPKNDYGDPSTMLLIEGMISGVSGTDKTVVIRPVQSLDEQLYVLHDLVEGNRFDGFILDHTLPQDPRVKYLLEVDFPFVTFGRTELFTPHAFFDVDDAYAAERMTAQLIDSGFRRIAIIGTPGHYFFAQQRLLGYRRALEAAGLGVDQNLLIETGMETRALEMAVEQLLALAEPPDAFVCPNEMSTIAVVRFCEMAGYDINRLGFASRDGTRFFDYFRPAVTSAYFPSFEVGEALSRLMLKRLNGEAVDTLQRVVKPKLLLR